MREAELLTALACQGEGIQVTLCPDGTVVIDSGFQPRIRVVENGLMKAAMTFARKVLESDIPVDAPIRKALKDYDIHTAYLQL